MREAIPPKKISWTNARASKLADPDLFSFLPTIGVPTRFDDILGTPMCGIVGILVENGSVPTDVLERATQSLAHRGPDDHGTVILRAESPRPVEIGLGNRRLAILDLSPLGHQPMQDPATGNWIVVGSHNPGLALTLTAGYLNYVSVPYHTTATNAATLRNEINTAIGSTVTLTSYNGSIWQRYAGGGIGQVNFNLTAGSAVGVLPVGSGSWTPATVAAVKVSSPMVGTDWSRTGQVGSSGSMRAA